MVQNHPSQEPIIPNPSFFIQKCLKKQSNREWHTNCLLEIDMQKDDQHRWGPKSGRNEKSSGQNSVVIKGIVLPVNWDADGNATAMVISTYNENEYMITPDEKSLELLAFLRQEVEIVGQIKTVNNKKYVMVKEYFPSLSGE